MHIYIEGESKEKVYSKSDRIVKISMKEMLNGTIFEFPYKFADYEDKPEYRSAIEQVIVWKAGADMIHEGGASVRLNIAEFDLEMIQAYG